MGEIDKLCEIFSEIAPGRVAAPTARLAVGEDDGEDSDVRAFEDQQSWAAREAERRLRDEPARGVARRVQHEQQAEAVLLLADAALAAAVRDRGGRRREVEQRACSERAERQHLRREAVRDRVRF